MDKCFFCKHGEMIDSYSTYVVDLKKCVVIVRNVPCKECNICGEKEIDDEVFEKLEQIVGDARESASELYVIDYSKKNSGDQTAA